MLFDEVGLKKLAENVACAHMQPCVIFLEGTLGAGKSTFARAFIQALCGADTVVPSPTFTLVQTYENSHIPIAHFDLYRIEDEDELLELGLLDYFTSHICLIEWPDKLGAWRPKKFMRVKISEMEKDSHRQSLRRICIEHQ